jgi:hypothetical protein
MSASDVAFHFDPLVSDFLQSVAHSSPEVTLLSRLYLVVDREVETSC